MLLSKKVTLMFFEKKMDNKFKPDLLKESVYEENQTKKVSPAYNIDCKFCGLKFKFTNQVSEHYSERHNFCLKCNKTFEDR